MRCLYHISRMYHGKKVSFWPRVPPYRVDEEDGSTPRVCLSPTIKGCIKAIGLDAGYNHVYRLVNRPRLCRPYDKNSIPEWRAARDSWRGVSRWAGYVDDADQSLEVWALQEVQLELVGSFYFKNIDSVFGGDYAPPVDGGFTGGYKTLKYHGRDTPPMQPQWPEWIPLFHPALGPEHVPAPVPELVDTETLNPCAMFDLPPAAAFAASV